MKKELMNEWANKLKDSDKAILVEGKKDKKALESLGITNIFTLSKKPIYAVVEEISSKHKEIVLLTDFDKEGKKLYGRIRSNLEQRGCIVDNYFREFLQKNTRLSHVEGILSVFKD